MGQHIPFMLYLRSRSSLSSVSSSTTISPSSSSLASQRPQGKENVSTTSCSCSTISTLLLLLFLLLFLVLLLVFLGLLLLHLNQHHSHRQLLYVHCVQEPTIADALPIVVDANLVDLANIMSLNLGGMKQGSNQDQDLKSLWDIDMMPHRCNTDLKDFSSVTFKVVWATLEIEDFSFSLISIDLTENIGIGATCTHVPCDHCYFIVDHC